MSYLDIITLIINTVTLHDNIVDTELTFTQGAEYVAPQYDQVDGSINKIYFYICISPVDLSDTEKKIICTQGVEVNRSLSGPTLVMFQLINCPSFYCIVNI